MMGLWVKRWEEMPGQLWKDSRPRRIETMRRGLLERAAAED